MADACVYIADEENGWLPANVLSQNGSNATVKVFSEDGNRVLGERVVNLNDYPDGQLPLQNVDASGNLMEMPDMVDLPSLHEAAILYNLKARHSQDKPYTRVGDLIIAVNPFKWIPELYSDENREDYVNKLIYQTSTSGADPRGGLDPHVYETSCMAYRGLAADGKHQSILVSGESGAGKTETVKIVMRHLSSVTSGASEESSLVVQRVLDGQPLLEAFGNAKTVRNNNSSRFGKFIQMEFDVEDATQAAYQGRAIPNCVLAGSVCETYLLEKSRVVSHEEGERGYHIFYQLLAASDENKNLYFPYLLGKTGEDFRYVGKSDPLRIDGLFDDGKFQETLDALKILDMDEEKLYMLFQAVACVMQLGNITFGVDPDDDERSVITSKDELETLSVWFGVSPKKIERALTNRTLVAGKESYEVPLKVPDARDGCDAFAKEIYQQIFEWLVKEINTMTCAANNYADDDQVQQYGLVALLDIFGFESFKVNRFEQLCINYTNEKLQQKYTVDIFSSVIEEYTHEGIDVGSLQYSDNVEVLKLIEGKIGIISVLNEECVRPKGNDKSFVSKVKEINKDVPVLIKDKLHKPTEFAIEHYAGVVKYNATMFVQKNTDALPKDVIDCACSSPNAIIQVELKAAADAKMGVATGKRGRRGNTMVTVATKFKSQLGSLMQDITQTKTRYIRCIKPNPQKVPLEMDMFTSSQQLRCAGVVAAVTISRVAFPNRLPHEVSLERFSCLSDISVESLIDLRVEPTEHDETGYKEIVRDIFDTLLKDMEKKEDGECVKAFECGNSRIYFRLGALESLEAKRLLKLGVFATTIERIVRGFTARSLFLKLKKATIKSEANARRTVGRKKFLRAKANAINIECWVRCIYAKRELKRLVRKKCATKIQTRWRTVMAQEILKNSITAAILIQKITRGALQRPKYQIALKEAADDARVNAKLAALQKRLQEAELKFFKADKQRIEAEKRAGGGGSALLGDGDGDIELPEDYDASPGSQALIDESKEMLEYFRKEVFKLKSANYLLRTDLQTMQKEHRELQSHAEATEASYTAMRHNTAKLSQSNMRLAIELGEEKSFILKLKKDLKMDRIRHNAELQRRAEEIMGKDKMHDLAVSKMKEQLKRLREICKENGIEVPEEIEEVKITKPEQSKKFERATFQNDQKVSLLKTLENHNKGEGTSLSKAFASSEPSPELQAAEEEGNSYRRYRRFGNQNNYDNYDNYNNNYEGGYNNYNNYNNYNRGYNRGYNNYRRPHGRHFHRGSFMGGRYGGRGRGRGDYFHQKQFYSAQNPEPVHLSLNKLSGTSLGAAANTPVMTTGSSLASAITTARTEAPKTNTGGGGGTSSLAGASSSLSAAVGPKSSLSSASLGGSSLSRARYKR